MNRCAPAAIIAILAGPAVAGADISAHDLDGDRFITFDELHSTAPGVTRAEFRDIDRNRDRRLSANEFSGSEAAALVSRIATSEENAASGPLVLRQADFSEIDVDRDGRVSFDELIRIDATTFTGLRGD